MHTNLIINVKISSVVISILFKSILIKDILQYAYSLTVIRDQSNYNSLERTVRPFRPLADAFVGSVFNVEIHIVDILHPICFVFPKRIICETVLDFY